MSFLWVFCLVIFFLFNMIIKFVLWIVESWWVIIKVVWFVNKFFRDFWIYCLFFELRLLVVLLRIKICGLVRIVCVIESCWCWLFDNLILCLLIIELYLVGNCLINLLIWVWWVVLSSFIFVVFVWLYNRFLWIVLLNRKIFCWMILSRLWYDCFVSDCKLVLLRWIVLFVGL